MARLIALVRRPTAQRPVGDADRAPLATLGLSVTTTGFVPRLLLPSLPQATTAALHVRGHGYDADRTVCFQHRQIDLGQVADLSVLADRGHDLVLGDPFTVQVRRHHLPALHQHDGDTLDKLAETGASQPEPGHAGVDREQCRCRNQAALESRVGADHGVLHRVGDEQDHDQVERGQLTQLASPTEAEPAEHGGIDDQ